MLSKKELLYTLALQRVSNLGDASAKKLIKKVGSAVGVFEEKKSNLLKIDGIGLFKLKDLSKKEKLDLAEKELEYIEQNQINYSYFLDSDYPKNLKHCLDGPILYFYTGNFTLKNQKIISIVGTRKITTYGKAFCNDLIEALAPLNPVIVSGFAYGVDIVAHRAAIKNGLQTIACLAHGLNQIYPKSHKKHVVEVEKNGGFITEFWSSDPFDRTNFLKRNRIIAGLSQATIVIESADKGGSLVTADFANGYNRDVFAVPGRTTDSQSQGCNNLIKTQRAHLLSNAADILYILGWDLEEKPTSAQQTTLFVELTQEEESIYTFLKKQGKCQLDSIALQCNIPTYKAATLLLNLELKGVVRPLPGKMFEPL